MLDAVDSVIGRWSRGPGGEDDATWLPSPDRYQYGTPNVGGVIGMATMLDVLGRIGMDEVRRHEFALVRRMTEGLASIGGISMYGPATLEERVAIIPFNVDDVSDMLTAAVLGGVRGRGPQRSICSHVHSDRLLRGDENSSAVRASIGLFNDETDVDAFLAAVEVVRRGDWQGNYRIRGGEVTREPAAAAPTDGWKAPPTPKSRPEVTPHHRRSDDRIERERPTGQDRVLHACDRAFPVDADADRALSLLRRHQPHHDGGPEPGGSQFRCHHPMPRENRSSGRSDHLVEVIRWPAWDRSASWWVESPWRSWP